MKKDSGSYAVFTKQGSSASQMTAAKVMDVIARLPGCAGQEDAPPLLKRSYVPVSRHLDTSTTTSGPKSWSNIEEPVVPLEPNLCGHPLAGFL